MLRLSSVLRAGARLHQTHHAAVASIQQGVAFSTQGHLTKTRFDHLAITENSKRAIHQELKYEYMTDVQQKTFAPIWEGKDVLSKAKTGNGKTMAFLLPAIERMVSLGLDNTPNSVPMLVISPTRELALQIATEARKIGQFHDLHVACFVGGTSVNKDTAVLKGPKPVDILVATPGRLLDHLSQDSAHIKRMLRKLQVLVLDEADRLLDMGFRTEIMKILNSVPAERQTLLFSATLPKSTQELTKLALRKEYELVNTVSEDDHQTNAQVKQEYVVCPADDVIKTMESLIRSHIEQHPQQYKVMVFFPTARAAQFMAQLFAQSGFKGTLEMHSRKSQAVRTKTADTFRKSKRVMLFSSDVSARGVDYPDVTLVVQVGLTDRDQYIHRLGRTARGGSEGHGILVLADFEKPLLNELKDLPLKKLESVPNMSDWESATAQTLAEIRANSELEKSAKQSYQAWIGFYKSNLKRLGLDKVRLVQLAEGYSQSIGLEETPKLDLPILKKMGLFGTPGLEPSRPGDARYRGSAVPKTRSEAPADREGRRRSASADGHEDHATHPRTARRPRSFSGDGAAEGHRSRSPVRSSRSSDRSRPGSSFKKGSAPRNHSDERRR